MSSGENSGEFDPEMDLLRRYEEMMGTQIETINAIDDKAAHTTRLIGILGGLVLTATSVAATTGEIEATRTTATALSMMGLGTTTLFVSLVFAIVTYLNSKFVYGPPAGLGAYLAQYRVSREEYRNALLRGYSAGVSANRAVVEDNSNRFKWCLALLVAALVFLFGGGVLLVLPGSPPLETLLAVAFGSTAVSIAVHIVREDYLVLETEGGGR